MARSITYFLRTISNTNSDNSTSRRNNSKSFNLCFHLQRRLSTSRKRVVEWNQSIQQRLKKQIDERRTAMEASPKPPRAGDSNGTVDAVRVKKTVANRAVGAINSLRN